jgi:transketolase
MDATTETATAATFDCRVAFAETLIELARQDSRIVAVCNDSVGSSNLTGFQKEFPDRMINVGIAEQNMVGVAAGVASVGDQAWAYSIAPFIYGRPFEQIRNDVCLHDLDVKLVGNGGGYGYGVMGATHHALEDYGVLLALQNMRAYVPAFADDVAHCVTAMSAHAHPAYLRLGRCEKPKDFELPPYAPWRRLLTGNAGILILVGPNAGPILHQARALPDSERPEIWVTTELPLAASPLPAPCAARIRETGALFILEEHVAQGSFGQMLAASLLEHAIHPRRFRHFAARGYLSGQYGSQAYHRAECGLDAPTVLATIRALAAA